MAPAARSDDTPLFCARCAAELHPGAGNFFQVTIEAVADPSPPDLETPPPEQDLGQQIQELIAQLEQVSEREALEQVHRRLILHLCAPCYRTWIEQPTG